jgi:protein-disulfide isomerase
VTVAEDGKVTVVEFLDYQCPACAAYYSNVTKRLDTDYAAAEQRHYREMDHALYDNYQAWALTPDGKQTSIERRGCSTATPTRIGLDLDRFHTHLSAEDVLDRIDAYLVAGREVGVTSTPTVFVNGERFEPACNRFADVDRQLRELIDEKLGA